MNTQPFTIERVFDASIHDIWKALTEKEWMKQWYFDLVEFKAEVGFAFQFSGGPSPEKQYLHLCEITEVIPEKKLSYTWRYDGYEGNSLLTFELFTEESKTRLVLTHEGLETFPASNPDFDKKNFEIGWTAFIHTSLVNFLKTIQNEK